VGPDVRPLTDVLAAYADLGEIREASVATGGFSGARIWKLTFDCGVFALRCWPTPGLPLDRIAELHRWLLHLDQAGLPVPLPRRHRGGTTVLEAAARFWQIEPWLIGEPESSPLQSESRLQEAMRVLAIVHRVSQSFVPSASGREWFSSSTSSIVPAISERLRRLAELGPRQMHELEHCRRFQSYDATLRELATRGLDFIRRCRDPLCDELRAELETRQANFPCWRDLWRANLLFSGDSVSGLIDPSAARTDHPAVDLARLLGSCVGDDRVLWQVALDSYQRERSLTITELRLIPVLDRSGTILSVLTWLERLADREISDGDVPRVTARLTYLVQRLSNISFH
jgi:Ser/Thr protein kinase RdoA (MazF antagonist)